MKKLHLLIFVFLLTLPGTTGLSQACLLKSEISPSLDIDDSRFNVTATVMDNDTWCLVTWPGYYDCFTPPLRDFMIQPRVASGNNNRDVDYYQVDRFSNFDPNGSPLLGDTTCLDTTSVSDYHDYDWAGLPMGWFAYGVKEHYTSGEWSDYNVSNIVGHLNYFDFTIPVTLTDTTWSDYTVAMVNGEIYPIEMDGCCGSIELEDIQEGSYWIYVSAPGNSTFSQDIHIREDLVFHIILWGFTYPVRNLYVDPVSLQATWDPPQVVNIDEDFEDDQFPPAGWQVISEGNGWFRTDDGSGAGWDIPAWNSYYSCTNDVLPGNDNNGSMDYLVTHVVDLSYRYNNYLSFYSYFDGSNGQEAFIEYSFDGIYWDPYYQLEPSTSWEFIELDISTFSGPEYDPIMFAFHADDNGQDASGWAVDNIRIYSPAPPYTLDGYYVYINDSLFAITDSNNIDISPLEYGEFYTIKVRAHYTSGLSSPVTDTVFCEYLYPPSCFYQADTGNMPLIMCPPMDSTGNIPPNFLGYNLYLNMEFIEFIPFPSIPPPPPAEWLQPGIYQYTITAVYDLTPYGYPGETGESMPLATVVVIRFGYPLPFLEQWNLGTFEINNWSIDGSNWSINGNEGNPDPCAEFTWDPIQTDYFISLESYPLLADTLTEGQIYLDFDLKLDNYLATGTEEMLLQVWNWDSQDWTTVKAYSNEEGSFDWISEHLDITNDVMQTVFKIRFVAQGEYSLNLLSWFVDNIHVYRTCNPPENLEANMDWNGMHLSWEKPAGTGFEEQWIHWDDGEVSGNSVFAGYNWAVAARWTPDQLTDFEGASITQIAFVPGSGQAIYKVRVWTGEQAANLLIDQEVIAPVVYQWNYITLNTPVPIDITQELWVGYHIHCDSGYPAGCDDGPAIDGYGNWCYWGNWQTLLEANPELDFNWSIEAFIEPGIIPDSAAAYAIYRSDDGFPYFLRDFWEQTYYLDDSVCDPGGSYMYKISALYVSGNDTCESDYSNEDGDICEGIYDKGEENYVSISPNPCNDLIKIESSEAMEMISLFNPLGELMMKEKVDERLIEIKIKDFPTGLYLMRISVETAVINRKIIIAH